MPICIHCATPVESLYMRYGQDHIVLSPCASEICSPVSAKASLNKGNSSSDKTSAAAVVLADEYLEHDLPIVIIDLILAKPQAYRHLLFNRSSIFASSHPSSAAAVAHDGRDGAGRQIWELLKRVLALSLVDAYIRWFYMCVQPPLPAWREVEKGGRTKVSERFAGVLSMHLPMQAGMFFPSLFTPRTISTEDNAIRAVCSAVPLWTARAVAGAEADAVLSTLISYSNTLLITLAETAALHLTVTLLTHSTIHFSAPAQARLSNNPFTPSKALLLSQLSPLLLLTFVLLWNTKFPHHSHLHSDSPPPQHSSRAHLVWIIRTFLTSLNAGVAIATVLPKGGGRLKRLAPAMILAAAWTVQALTSAALYSWLS
ncbi:hypothetical protein EX895_006145 [Sporisorium graminicola]|uniref:Protein ARV n=1 Tax=Sporisorium graminicola TaxID=280036 RepID=A0A4U7KLC2_9BASI|nr:hypothetical protein EX895_006145 [Sporisorium graminicola]TKY85065.1 hypothetical protein EX895_006145 [Sporisorium graminicola]